MTDEELNRRLKSVRVPARTEEHWERFPERVTRALTEAEASAPPAAVRVFPLLRLAALGAGCALVVLALVWPRQQPAPQPVSSVPSALPETEPSELVEGRKIVSELANLFPRRLRSLRIDKEGVSMDLADESLVPDSTPLFLRFCQSGECESIVTFSGQQLELDGLRFEVLQDAEGNVMLVGESWFWSSAETGSIPGNLTVSARPLELVM